MAAVEQAARGYRVTPSRGAWLGARRRDRDRILRRARGSARSRPGCRRLSRSLPTGYRQPVELARRRRAGRRRVGVGRADRATNCCARAGAVTLAAGRHTRLPRVVPRARHPVVARPDRDSLDVGADDVHDIERLAQPAVAAARRPARPRARSTSTLLRRQGVRVGRPAARRRRRAASGSPTISSRHRGVRREAGDAAAAPRRLRRGRRLAIGRSAPRAVRTDLALVRRRAGPTLDLGGRRDHVGGLGDGLPPRYPWLDVPVLDRARRDRASTAASRRRPASTCSACSFQRRRNSTFIDGVGKDAALPRRRDRRAPRPHRTCHRVKGIASWTHRSVDRRRRRRRRAVRRRGDGDAAGASRPRACSLVDRGEYGTDTLSTHALMRGGVLQLARWGLLERIVAAGTPPVTVDHVPLRHRAADASPSSRSSASTALYAPRRTVLDRVLVDAAAAAGAIVRFGTRLTALLARQRRRRRRRASAGSRRADRCRSARSIVVGADGLRSTVADLVGAPVLRAAATRLRCSTATGPTFRSTATTGTTARRARLV